LEDYDREPSNYKEFAEPILNKDMLASKNEKEWKPLNRKAVAIIQRYKDKSLFDQV